MTQSNASINFSGSCRQAMTFYKGCLDAALILETIEGSPMEAQCPAATKGQILHASLTKGALLLMGSDMVGPSEFIPGNNIALNLNCSSEKEINNFFTKLSEGGSILDPLKLQFWGALFGVIVDKFGIRWMFNYDKNQNL